MSFAVSRAVLRRSAKLPFGRTPARFESTASKATEAAKDTASKASEKASDFQTKASEGLSRVSSAAGPAISGAAKGVSNALGKIGGRTGRFIAFVERKWHMRRLNPCDRQEIRSQWLTLDEQAKFLPLSTMRVSD